MAKKTKILEPTLISQKTDKKTLIKAIVDETPVILSPKEEEKFDELLHCRELYFKLGSRFLVIKSLIENENYSQYKAAKLADDCTRYFSVKVKSEGVHFHIDLHLERIAETRELAKNCNNLEAMIQCDKNYETAIAKFLNEAQAIDLSEFNLPDIVIDFRPELFKDIPEIDSQEYEKLRAKVFNRIQEIQLDEGN